MWVLGIADSSRLDSRLDSQFSLSRGSLRVVIFPNLIAFNSVRAGPALLAPLWQCAFLSPRAMVWLTLRANFARRVSDSLNSHNSYFNDTTLKKEITRVEMTEFILGGAAGHGDDEQYFLRRGFSETLLLGRRSAATTWGQSKPSATFAIEREYSTRHTTLLFSGKNNTG